MEIFIYIAAAVVVARVVHAILLFKEFY